MFKRKRDEEEPGTVLSIKELRKIELSQGEDGQTLDARRLRTRYQDQGRHLSDQEINQLESDDPEYMQEYEGNHLSWRELSAYEKANGDSPTLRAIVLIGVFFLLLQSLNAFHYITRVRQIWAGYVERWQDSATAALDWIAIFSNI